MRKFTLRIGLCGFAIAWLLFAASFPWRGSAQLVRLEMVFWPTSMLLAASGGAMRLGAGLLAATGFSALMNGAAYFGVAWLAWWIAHLAGKTKTPVSAKERFVSVFLAVGLGFSLLVALGEAAIHGLPKFAGRGLAETWLASTNLFALIVITCASSGWTMWWLREFFRRRSGAARSD